MFKTLQQSKKSSARLGEIKVKSGVIQTPFFMPDATRGVIKSLSTSDLEKLNLQAMVVNTYHLLLQPGMNLIKKSKGIHQFMNYSKPLLSDSGGFQVFSLIHKNPRLGKIYNDKVKFKSPIDGKEHELTPEKSIQIQFDLGTDMIVVLDDCPPNSSSKIEIEKAISHTIHWAKKCKAEYNRQIKKRKISKSKRPLLFGVIQGGENLDLRKHCAEKLVKIGFDGLGFGARPVDQNGKFLQQVLKVTADSIPESYLKFGLGIGTPDDIVKCVKLGWDMFDCVIPTREARHGRLFYFTSASPERGAKRQVEGSREFQKSMFSKKFYKTINIKNSKFSKDFSAINSTSKNSDLQKYSKAYLHHLFKINENLAHKLATVNNLEFYMELMAKIRQEIKNNQI